MKEEDLKEHFKVSGDVKNVVLFRDKITTQSLGHGFVQFDGSDKVQVALEKHDKEEVGERHIRLKAATDPNRIKLELPEDLLSQIRELLRAKCEGMNLSRIRDTW